MFNNKLGNKQHQGITRVSFNQLEFQTLVPTKASRALSVVAQCWSQSEDGQIITQWYASVRRGYFLINVVGRSSIRSIGSKSYAKMVTSSRQAKANISRGKVAVGIPTTSKSKVQMGKRIFLFSHQQGQGGRLHKWLKG